MRKFGVEIEAGLRTNASIYDVINALGDAGLGGRHHTYIGHSATEWVVKEDSSVRHGVEVVSPPLDFDNPYERDQVNVAIEAISNYCKPIPSAGIHVHVDTHDLTASQVASVSRIFNRFEDVIYRLGTSGWRTLRDGASAFAAPMTPDTKDAIGKARTSRQLAAAYYGSSSNWMRGDHWRTANGMDHSHQARYYGLNLHSHFYRGTIEFRVFNSSMNARRVQSYIAICMAMVQEARAGNDGTETLSQYWSYWGIDEVHVSLSTDNPLVGDKSMVRRTHKSDVSSAINKYAHEVTGSSDSYQSLDPSAARAWRDATSRLCSHSSTTERFEIHAGEWTISVLITAVAGTTRDRNRSFPMGSMKDAEDSGDHSVTKKCLNRFIRALKHGGLSDEDAKNVKRIWKDTQAQAAIPARRF
jgi:hypothetical protein